MDDLDLAIAREAHAQIADEQGAAHTASLYRSGQYDDKCGTLHLAARAAKLARERDEADLRALFEKIGRPRRIERQNGAHCDWYDRLAARLGLPGSIS